MVNVGVIGLGVMGTTHLDVYSKHPGVKVVAVSDKDPAKLAGKKASVGNIEGQAKGGFDFSTVTKYDEGMALIHDPNVQVVDICLVTPLHVEYGIAALEAGKHLLIEKPLARNFKEASKLLAVASKSRKYAMPAQCMRFWPGWTDLKKAVEEKTYGKVLSASFTRVGSHPGGPFYSNGKLCGGGALDLHVHDTDFIQFLFGMPKAVVSRGYARESGAIDHIVTQYVYDKIPLVTAEGGWSMSKGFGFKMRYTVNFERGTLVFDLANADKLTLFQSGKDPVAVKIEAGAGYDHEIAYFINCVETKTKPKTVTLKDAANSVKIVEAEVQSVAKGGKPVAVKA
jgi:predicted dehydrogenase